MDSGYSGTASDFDRLTIRIKDNGTLRAITWGTTNWESAGVPLPTTTTAGKLMTIGFIVYTLIIALSYGQRHI